MATDNIDEFLRGLIRYAEHLPGNRKFPIEVLVLKGHLLIEEELRSLVQAKFVDPGAYDLERSKYSSLLRLARALYGAALPQWKWASAKAVNEMRNSIAHRLENDEVERRLEELCRGFEGSDSAFVHVERDKLKQLAYCLSAIHSSLLALRT